MQKEWTEVDLLRHSRHDWLNKLQLIKGNLALNRIDRVHEIIQEIVNTAQNETKLSNLKAVQFASLLMTFNWEPHYFTLEFEVIGEERNMSTYDFEVTSWCCHFFSLLNHSIKPYVDNHLSVSIQISSKEFRFFFDFSGILEDMEEVRQWLEHQKAHPTITIVNYQIHKDELSFVIQIND